MRIKFMELIKGHKIVTLAAAVVVIGMSAGVSAIALNAQPAEKKEQSIVQVEKKIEAKPVESEIKEEPAEETKPASEPVASPAASTQTQAAAPTEEPEFNLRSLTTEYIEQASMTDRCIELAPRTYFYGHTKEQWSTLVYTLIEKNHNGVHKNHEGKMICVYSETIEELKG